MPLHTSTERWNPGRLRGSARQILATRVGLDMPPLLTYEKWEEAGIQISRIADCSAWCLGDWIVYGQEMYADRYQQAIDAARLDYQTLRNYAWVARRFPHARRRENLSFQHHAEVAALPEAEQDQWLRRAEQHRWSRNQLRRQLRESRGPERAPSHDTLLPRLAVQKDQLERWQRAAEKARLHLEPWLISALDRAAIETLGEAS